MEIIKPFIASRRFAATIGVGTGTGANGMLQPLIVYKVSEGVLTIDGVPEKVFP
ncbi:hypothetical protein [Paenibacillus sp. MER TA 81-3]|uniref:hypothetical protein n=1 Tax=Paenibacillus sp. MER TA 81-3 TaxID=2939573 RepID=UPI00203D2218|nr:hypothetical protein [Paenibacillus sp. MER TA 81-3]